MKQNITTVINLLLYNIRILIILFDITYIQVFYRRFNTIMHNKTYACYKWNHIKYFRNNSFKWFTDIYFAKFNKKKNHICKKKRLRGTE